MFNFKPNHHAYIYSEIDSIYYNGNFIQAEGVKLKGKIILNDLRGNTETYLTFRSILIRHSNGILTNDCKYVMYNRDYKFNFRKKSSCSRNSTIHDYEILLPGNLPTSLNLDSFSIIHEVKVYEKRNFGKKLLGSKTINLYRLPRLQSHNYLTFHASNTEKLTTVNGFIENKASYSVEYPMTCYNFDSSKEVIITINSNNECFIKSITYSIKQVLELGDLKISTLKLQPIYNYQLNSFEIYNKPSTPQLYSSKNHNLIKILDGTYSERLVIRSNFIPCNEKQAKYSEFTTNNEEFSIYHFILIQLVLINSYERF
ncbi:hypothetical protein CONCODRAFT_11743 [Conidiobolus coronatus NRRL 28638]|uniref:Arrestin-like N-terminal domain-containing protein n=1 Tax=Conidiobolus coronatus (strain ATCC 28846 / CBS 209.66 / NRRL 28638) TaxID=796925 RepID=A0A137NUJ1_CONC2|nr:hypothetical protein CONCODRAFT_11743 [Conidiobolus coronatus NRRL 28638]|eukprot:KXN66416.1 hypothetical protein CONCODRAFT_11743 [Conidiobolus coronatus NRRL 28638]